jgi:threonyl-tRNA synthetase
MRILTVHADYMEVEPLTKAIKSAEQVQPGKQRYDEVLVVFTAVEKGDENIGAIAQKLAKEADAVAKQVKVNNVLLYPLVHLTSNPSDPATAQKVMEKAEELLKNREYKVAHSPFGWYKGYTLKCKGHPLSELSRELKASGDEGEIKEGAKKGEEVSKSLQAEAKLANRFYILDLEGKLHDPENFDYGAREGLKKFAHYETKKVRAYEREPPHIKIMKAHSLIDYEPGSDSGNFRFLPKGRLIKKLLEDAITDYCVGCGAMEVETPIMYDMAHPTLKKYLDRFPARQYTVLSDDKKLFLRFAACFGQFLIAHDLVISHKHLPLKMFELTKYSFRREQGGELAGLKRLRAFTMPDMHSFTIDMESAKAEFEKQLQMSLEWNDALGLETEVGFRILQEFYDKNKDWYLGMVKKVGKPVLVEMFSERYAYFITKFEFNFVDSMHKASALSTVQIDVENADTYDISYVDEKGEKKRPLILHASLSGSLERVIYALLEREAMRIEQGKKPVLPVWLAPTQLRLIPVSDVQNEYCGKLLEQLKGRRVRIDMDERNETLGKKIRDAEHEWVPYIAVIGENETKSGMLNVRVRTSGERKDYKFEELVSEIEKLSGGKPFELLSLSPHMSKRPVI